MTGPRLERAKQLVAEITDALAAAGLDGTLATLDATDVQNGLEAGVVVVSAPRLTFAGGFDDVQARYRVHIVAGPVEDYLRSWDRIDVIIQALVAANINLRDGEPEGFALMYGEVANAYTLTLNDLD